MEHFSYFSNNFNLSNTASYTLSMQTGNSTYAYCIADSVRSEYVAVKCADYDEKTKDMAIFDKIKIMINQDAILNKSYKSINFAFLSRKSTLIPSPLFDKNALKKLFQMNHPVSEDEELHFNYIDKIDAYNAFAMPSKITTFMVNHFPEIRFFHHSTSFINQAFEESQRLKFKLPTVILNVNEDFIDLLVIISEKPVLYNSFMYKTNTDIIYHAVNVLQQLDIKPTKCYVFLAGKLSGEQANLPAQIKGFLPSAEIIRPGTDYTYEYKDAPAHLVYNVLNLHKCE